MARIVGEHIVTLTSGGVLEMRGPEGPDEGRIVLREPTNEEWNKYDSSRFEFSKKGRLKRDNQPAGKCELFDALVVNISGIEDDRGEITPDDLDRVPARYKQRAIFLCFEDESTEDVDDTEKN